MICLTRLTNSIDWLLRHGGGRRGVDPGLLLQTDNGKGENVQNDCVSVVALCRGSVV